MTFRATLLPTVVVGCFGLLALLVIAAAIFARVYKRLSITRFRNQYRGKCLLVCGRRHGWYDFVINNVAPMLPADCLVVWSTTSSRPILIALRHLGLNEPKPLLVYVGNRRVAAKSLHAALLPLRTPAARNESIQQKVSILVADAFGEIKQIADHG